MEMKMLRIQDVAKASGLTVASCYNLQSQGRFVKPMMRFGMTAVYSPRALAEWLKSRAKNPFMRPHKKRKRRKAKR